MIQARIKHDPFWTNFIYLFRIPLNHEKYLLFEYDDFNSGNNVIFTISENGNVTVYENTTLRQEGYLELKNECTYNIRIKINIAGYPRKSTDVYFRLVQSKYIKYLPVEINTEYFLYYRVIKPTYLLLNMSTIEKGNKMMIEYNKNWGKEYKGGNDFIIYGYNTINEYTINDKSGKELELIESEDYDYIRRTFIHKNSEDIKLVLFKIQFKAYTFSDTIFSIKYGETEFQSKNFYLNFNFGMISVGVNLKNEFYNDFFKSRISEGLCDEKVYKNYFIYSCINDNNKVKFNELKEFHFIHQGLEYDFVFNYNDLFIDYNNRKYFLLTYKLNSMTTVFGKPFFKKYKLVFNPDSKQIGHYIKEELNLDGENNNSNNKTISKTILFIAIIIVLIIVISILGYILHKKLKKKKRKNELDENFDYIPEENEKNIIN
jgi:hypothetical protein